MKRKFLIGLAGLVAIASSISCPRLLRVKDAATGKALSGAHVVERCMEMSPSAGGGSQKERYVAAYRTGGKGFCFMPPRVVFHFPLLTWLDHEFGVYVPGYFPEFQTRAYSVRLQPMEMYLDYCPYRTPRGYILPMNWSYEYPWSLSGDSLKFSGDFRHDFAMLAQQVQFSNLTARGVYLTFPGFRLTQIATVQFESNFRVFDSGGKRWIHLSCHEDGNDGHEASSFLYKMKMGKPEPSAPGKRRDEAAPAEFRMIKYTNEIFRVCKSERGWSVYHESETRKNDSRLLGEISTDRSLLAACIGAGLNADLYLAFQGLGVRRFVLPKRPELDAGYVFKEDPAFAFNIQSVLARNVVAMTVGSSPAHQAVLYVVCGDETLYRFSLAGIPDGKVTGFRLVEAVDRKTWGNDKWLGLARGGRIEPLKTRDAGSGREVVPEYDPDVARAKEMARMAGQRGSIHMVSPTLRKRNDKDDRENPHQY